MNERPLVKIVGTPSNLMFDPANITKETIKSYLCKEATDQELTYGLQVCKTFNLNPLKREVYFVKYGTEPMQILTGYEVYLKRADRSEKYGGMKAWTEGSVETGDLKGCIEVYRLGWDRPLYHEVDYAEYVQKKKDGSVNRFWSSKPKTMIKKVATSQAFRLAFPDEFDGMPYTTDEVIDQSNIIDITRSSSAAEAPAPAKSTVQAPTAKPPVEGEAKVISEKQGKRLIAIAIENDYTKGLIEQYVKAKYGWDRLAQITPDKYDEIVAHFEKKEETGA